MCDRYVQVGGASISYSSICLQRFPTLASDRLGVPNQSARDYSQKLRVPVRIGCFVPLPPALGFASVLPFWGVGRARWPAFRLGMCILGFPAVCVVTTIPSLAQQQALQQTSRVQSTR